MLLKHVEWRKIKSKKPYLSKQGNSGDYQLVLTAGIFSLFCFLTLFFLLFVFFFFLYFIFNVLKHSNRHSSWPPDKLIKEYVHLVHNFS